MITRRSLLGFIALAPAIVRASSLMALPRPACTLPLGFSAWDITNSYGKCYYEVWWPDDGVRWNPAGGVIKTLPPSEVFSAGAIVLEGKQ